jgi:hypothetical protein
MKSSHSRFSLMKRKRRRLRREQKSLSKVQTKETVNQAPRQTEAVLRESPERADTSHLPKLPQRFRKPHPATAQDGRSVLLDDSVPVSEPKECACCGLVWNI